MPGEISVDRLVVQAVLGLGMDGMRSRADQRQVALEHYVDELRQFVEACLADEASDPRHARIAPAHQPRGGRVALLGVHRAELEHFD